ncbi:MAG: hypothetical protein OQK04_10085 [Kangiellaceae bacterium]|nr:hypothetical protein [Kangiellaceae bacterium]MCW8999053.1 hypothetical protein [Kangiellaceae bacterium]
MSSILNRVELEKRIIELTQAGLPIESRPFKTIADKLGISESAVVAIFDSMKQKGLVRRIGLVPNHYAIGYLFNLMTVWDIEDSDIDQVGKSIGELDFVSHCYQRPRHLPDWPYNFFAMIHGKTEQEANEKMQQIADLVKDSCSQFTALKSCKILKKTGLRI